MDFSPNSPPKLALFSFPAQSSEPPEVLTPPLVKTSASVPFKWEEAPGKPLAGAGGDAKLEKARCLELPPRLLVSEGKLSNLPSPTTVLDGPYVGRSVTRTFSFRSFRSPESLGKVHFGSSRWVSSYKKSKEVSLGGSLDFSSSLIEGDSEGCGGGGGGCSTKTKITRVRRRSSFLSNTKSQLWASIYESFKGVVVPWRRSRQEKMRKMGK